MKFYVLYKFETEEGWDEPTRYYEYYESEEDALKRLDDLYKKSLEEIKDDYQDEEEEEMDDTYFKEITIKSKTKWEIDDSAHYYRFVSCEVFEATMTPMSKKVSEPQITFWPGAEKEVK